MDLNQNEWESNHSRVRILQLCKKFGKLFEILDLIWLKIFCWSIFEYFELNYTNNNWIEYTKTKKISCLIIFFTVLPNEMFILKEKIKWFTTYQLFNSKHKKKKVFDMFSESILHHFFLLYPNLHKNISNKKKFSTNTICIFLDTKVKIHYQ